MVIIQKIKSEKVILPNDDIFVIEACATCKDESEDKGAVLTVTIDYVLVKHYLFKHFL
jgi:hypothetical protein